jgi:hypothetical protein
MFFLFKTIKTLQNIQLKYFFLTFKILNIEPNFWKLSL